MKVANEVGILRALEEGTPAWRLALLHGPDEGGSRLLGERFAATMGAGAERVDLDGAALRTDPARLTDEATAISMFGDARWVRVTGGEEVLPAVEALLEAPRGCPVIVISAQLKPASALARLANDRPDLLSYVSWKPAAGRGDAIAVQLGRTLGVRLESDAARLVAEATGGDRALLLRELEKLALYVDAAVDRPRAVSAADVGAIGAAIDVREAWDLVDALFDAKPDALAAELSGEAAVDMIPALRAVQRRALLVARGKAGLSIKAGGSDRSAAERQSRRWASVTLATVHERTMAAEAAVKRPGTAGEVVAGQTLLNLARAAARVR